MEQRPNVTYENNATLVTSRRNSQEGFLRFGILECVGKDFQTTLTYKFNPEYPNKLFCLGKAKVKEDSIFDSCAQILNEKMKDNLFSVKSMREACKEHMSHLDNKLEDNSIRNSLTKAQYVEYLANLLYTAEEREKGEGVPNDLLTILENQDIDCQIICGRFNLNLHVIEVVEKITDDTDKDQSLFIVHSFFDKNGKIERDPSNWDDTETITIHLAKFRLHYVPILKNPEMCGNLANPAAPERTPKDSSSNVVRTREGRNENKEKSTKQTSAQEKDTPHELRMEQLKIKLAKCFLKETKRRAERTLSTSQSDESTCLPNDMPRQYPVFEIRDPEVLLQDKPRRFIYLTSVGQKYHEPEYFSSQFKYLKETIKADIKTTKDVDADLLDIFDPYEIVILIGDSLQAYNHPKRENSEEFKLGSPRQCIKLLKHEREEYIDRGKRWHDRIRNIYTDIQNELFREIAEITGKNPENFVHKVKVVFWSEKFDHLTCSDDKNKESTEFIDLICKVEDALKYGIMKYFSSGDSEVEELKKWFNENIKLLLWDARYIIEEGVGIFDKLVHDLFKIKVNRNNNVYLLYPAEIKELFGAVRDIINIIKNPLIKTHTPKSVFVRFNDASSNNTDTKNNNQENVFRARQDLMLDQQKNRVCKMLTSDYKQQSFALKKLKELIINCNNQVDLSVPIQKFNDAHEEHLHTQMHRVAKPDTECLNLKDNRFHRCVSLLVDTLVFMREGYQRIAHQNLQSVIRMNLFIAHEIASTPLINCLTYKMTWDNNDYVKSVCSNLSVYLAWWPISKNRKHLSHATKVIDMLAEPDLKPNDVIKILMREYIKNFLYCIDNKDRYNPQKYSACYFYCFLNLMNRHGVDPHELHFEIDAMDEVYEQQDSPYMQPAQSPLMSPRRNSVFSHSSDELSATSIEPDENPLVKSDENTTLPQTQYQSL